MKKNILTGGFSSSSDNKPIVELSKYIRKMMIKFLITSTFLAIIILFIKVYDTFHNTLDNALKGVIEQSHPDIITTIFTTGQGKSSALIKQVIEENASNLDGIKIDSIYVNGSANINKQLRVEFPNTYRQFVVSYGDDLRPFVMKSYLGSGNFQRIDSVKSYTISFIANPTKAMLDDLWLVLFILGPTILLSLFYFNMMFPSQLARRLEPFNKTIERLDFIGDKKDVFSDISNTGIFEFDLVRNATNKASNAIFEQNKIIEAEAQKGLLTSLPHEIHTYVCFIESMLEKVKDEVSSGTYDNFYKGVNGLSLVIESLTDIHNLETNPALKAQQSKQPLSALTDLVSGHIVKNDVPDNILVTIPVPRIEKIIKYASVSFDWLGYVGKEIELHREIHLKKKDDGKLAVNIFIKAKTNISELSSNLFANDTPFRSVNDFIEITAVERILQRDFEEAELVVVGGKKAEHRIIAVRFDIPFEQSSIPLAPKEGNGLKGMQGLFIDDNEINIMAVNSMLEFEADVVMDEAEDGESGIKACKQQSYDFVLVDYLMPGLNGVETIEEIRAIPGYEKKPIILVTADGNFVEGVDYPEHEFDGVVKKPVANATLIENIVMAKIQG